MVQLTEDDSKAILEDLCGRDEQREAALLALSDGDEPTLRELGPSLSIAASLHVKREAARLQNAEILRFLLECDPELSENVVVEAFDRKDWKCIRVILDFGWDINTPLWQVPPLYFAIHNEEFARWLIAKGADVDTRQQLGQPALTYAIAHGDIAIVHLLLAESVDVTWGNLLHSAVEREDQIEGAEIIEILVRNGADVNAIRHDNPIALPFKVFSLLPTPLYLACEKENIPAVRALLKHGADPRKKVLRQGLPGSNCLEKVKTICNPQLLELVLGSVSNTVSKI